MPRRRKKLYSHSSGRPPETPLEKYRHRGGKNQSPTALRCLELWCSMALSVGLSLDARERIEEHDILLPTAI
jgi:hypothetical protein